MNGADQERREELASLYALGMISGDEQVQLRDELRAAPDTADLLRGLTRVGVGLAQAVPLVDPPAALRARVLTGVTGTRFTPVAVSLPPAPKVLKQTSAAWPGWMAAAAALIVAVAAGSYAVQLQRRVDRVEQQLNQAEQDVIGLRRTLTESQQQTQTLRLQAAVFMAPDVNRVDLAGQAPIAPGAAGRAYWSRSHGVVFAATRLPALPAGKTYQLWFVPANAAPVSAGLIAPDAQGSATLTFPMPPATPERIAAMAVTLEPAGGVPAPTGEKYLVGVTGN